MGPPEHAESTLFAAAAGQPGPFTSAPSPAASPRAETDGPRRAFVPGRHGDDEAVDEGTLAAAGLNPLLGNATALLALAARLRDGPGVADLDGLRERAIAEVRRFDQASLGAGLAPEDVRMARYAICATVDDLILSTEWGAASGWAGRSLVSTIYSETWGGERFFDILDHLLARPGNNLDVLELMAVCLALGFVGKYRVMPQGQSDLAEVRDNLFRTLRQVRGDFDRALSPQWRGLDMAHRPPPSRLVPVLVAAIVAVSLGILYMVLSATLTARTEVVTRDLIESVPVGPPSILRPEVAPTPLPVPTPPVGPGLYERLSAFLAPEIAARQIELARGAGTVTIRLLGGGTFASATATVQLRDLPLLRRIGEALAPERGAVVVVGHTDSQPIRTARFPSNFELSLARAASVVEVLRGVIGDPTRLRAEGAADRDPLAGNDTREGRARNRRIEIVVPAEVAGGAINTRPGAAATAPGAPSGGAAGGSGPNPGASPGRPGPERLPTPVYQDQPGAAPAAGGRGG
ncbi:type IVB secretion system protein IcmH/DotU [Roseospira visakhapatnamensis]|uniref:Type VI secretion system protein ImpK n=1 Tax=Roseospira visakhapatnamensis TaxID=390880 RepID=A0A7W6REH5_9PROT|nr:type VI secretion system protein ImpK [Roseospira visakhapatnamensis]